MPLGDRLRIQQVDITTLDVDAIVNAANVALATGGGVCGAIHRAAGPDLAEACRDVAPCPTGEVRLTPGFDLRARYVLHAVGPMWHGDGYEEDRALANCYRHALQVAEQNGLASIAFPAISTGIYGFPLERATAIALREIAAGLERAERVRTVVCACYDAQTLAVYERTRAELNL